MTIFLAFSIRNSSVSQYFLELANSLSKDYRVFVIADVVGPHKFHISPRIEILQWPDHPQKMRSFLFLSDLVKKHDPRIMISNFSAVGTFLIVGYLHRVPHRIAWCHSISEQFLEKRPGFDRKRWIYKLATQLIANSMATEKDLVENFGMKKRSVRVFYNAFNDPHMDTPVNLNQIAFAGRLDISKGVDVLLKAMPEVLLHFPKVRLKFLGTGNQLGPLKDLARSLGIEQSIEFLGNQSREKVLEVFSSSYYTIVPSRVEAFGYVVIESFAVKTPVIGSDTSGIAEIIRNGKDGILFKNSDTTSLSEQMVRLLKNPELRHEMSYSCYGRFREKFELQERVHEISTYIRELTKEAE